VFWDEDYATGAVCARCDKDATQMFEKLKVLVFHAPVWRER
jgi:hypothetical protein